MKRDIKFMFGLDLRPAFNRVCKISPNSIDMLLCSGAEIEYMIEAIKVMISRPRRVALFYPESGMHIEFQSCLASWIKKTKHKDCRVSIYTHSPEIVANNHQHMFSIRGDDKHMKKILSMLGVEV